MLHPTEARILRLLLCKATMALRKPAPDDADDATAMSTLEYVAFRRHLLKLSTIPSTAREF